MRDVIGQDDLEEAAPSGRRRGRGAGWLAAAALLAGGVAVVGTGSTGGDEPGPADVRGGPGSSSGTEDPPGRAGRGALVRAAPPVQASSGLRGSLAVRPLGGRTVAVGPGAAGEVRLEVRNGGAPLRLWALTAEVPGVRFAQVVGPNGVPLRQDERAELVLAFRIDDCAQLRRTGRLVLLVEQAGVRQEVGLTVTHDREAGTVRQVALDRVLGACPD